MKTYWRRSNGKPPAKWWQSSQLLSKMRGEMIIQWSSSRCFSSSPPPPPSPSPSPSSSIILWEGRQCSKLLCQMRRKMMILRCQKGVIICQTQIRRGRWQCRLGDVHHPNMMWSPMASGTVQSPLGISTGTGKPVVTGPQV
jgi:hypothetical protein